MSANNQLLIRKKGKKYEIYENCCVDNEFNYEEHKPIHTETSLKKAIRWANDYCIDHIIEYGVHVDI